MNLFADTELNEDIRENLDTFFQSSIIGQKVDFINRQRENPDPVESYNIIPTDITDEQGLEVLRKMNKLIWG